MASGVELAERVEKLPRAEGPWPLMEGWCWTTLGRVLSPISSIDPKSALGERTFHYVDLSAVENGRVSKSRLIPGNEAPSRARQVIQAGDTLFSCVRVYLQNIALLGEELSTPVASTAYCVMRPSEVVDPRFLNLFVRSRRFIEWMIPLQRGNSPPAVLDGDLKAQAFPLAPLPEQRRIVAAVDALIAEIDDGEAALAVARKGLDTFRRALLKAAITGELTKDWRAENPVSETGHDLLARIARDRVGASPKGRARRTESAPIDTSALQELPNGWVWATLDQVKSGDQRNGISIAGSPSPPGVKAMRLDALTTRGLDLEAVRYIPLPEDRISIYEVNAGDLLVSRANGSPEFVGRAVYVDEIAEPVVFPDTMIRYPLGADRQTGRWMELAWNSPLGRGQIRRLAKTTAGILKISQEDISQIALPVPPPAEAAEILRRVSEALAASAETLALLDVEAGDAIRLKQSVLKAAFEGRLSSQGPDDEPACALLSRMSDRRLVAPPTRRAPPRKSEA